MLSFVRVALVMVSLQSNENPNSDSDTGSVRHKVVEMVGDNCSAAAEPHSENVHVFNIYKKLYEDSKSRYFFTHMHVYN